MNLNDLRTVWDYKKEQDIKSDGQLITWLTRNAEEIFKMEGEEKRRVFLADKKTIKRFER